MSPSYIIPPDPAPHSVWPFFPDNSMLVFAAPRRPRRRRRPLDRAAVYAALLQADEYAEEARDALRAGEDALVLHALEVMRAIVAVAIEQISSSEYLGRLQ